MPVSSALTLPSLLTGAVEQSVGGQLLQDHRMTHYWATGRSEVERV